MRDTCVLVEGEIKTEAKCGMAAVYMNSITVPWHRSLVAHAEYSSILLPEYLREIKFDKLEECERGTGHPYVMMHCVDTF